MGIVGAISGQSSMQAQAGSPQQTAQALELQAQQMLGSGNIPPMNLKGVRADQLQGVMNGLIGQAQSAGQGTAVDALSRYRIQELMTYAQHMGVQLSAPQNSPTAQAPTQAIGGYPQLQQQQPQQAANDFNLPSSPYEEYQLGMGIPGYGLDVGGTHFDYGTVDETRMYQLMLASGGSPGGATSAAPAQPMYSQPQPMAGYAQPTGYGASPYGQAQAGYGASSYGQAAMGGYGSPMGQTAAYGASPYGQAAMGGYGANPYAAANPYGQAAMGGYGVQPQGYGNSSAALNPYGQNAFVQAVGGTIGDGMTSDAIRNLGTTISTTGMGGATGVGGLDFLNGGSISPIGANYGKTPGYGGPSAGMNGLGGLGALGGNSPFGSAGMGSYGAANPYGQAPAVGYGATAGLGGYGAASPYGQAGMGGYGYPAAAGGYSSMNIGSSYGGTAMMNPAQQRGF